MSNFLLGLSIGLTVGLLFAPKSGNETRELIANKANEGTDYLANQADQLKAQASDLVQKGRNILADQREKLTSAAQKVQETYQS